MNTLKIRQSPFKVSFWEDWIKVDKRDGYVTSQTELPGYHNRVLGVATDDSGTIYIAASVNKERDDDSNKSVAKTLISNRLRKAMASRQIMPNDKMVTLVTPSYLSLLYEDTNVYSALMGPVNKEALEESLSILYADRRA